MALEIYELQETRSANVADGRATATRRFRIFDDAAPITTPNAIRSLFGSSFGGTTLPNIGDEMVGDQTIFATGYSIRHVPDSRNLWEVEFNYENTEVSSSQPLDIGYVESSVSYESRFENVWRTNPSLPSTGNQGTPQSTPPGNVSGTQVDNGGEPLSVLRHRSTMTLRETVAASTMQARILAIIATRGKRNNASFQGASQGSVLYLGAQASRVALDKFSIEHRFSHDDWFHLIQSPAKGPDGNVLLKLNGGILRASIVNWVQPFPGVADFGALSENF